MCHGRVSGDIKAPSAEGAFMFLDFAKNYPALVSVVAITFGWFVTRRGQIHGDRAKHSHGYVDFLSEDKYLSAFKEIAPFLNEARPYFELDCPDEEERLRKSAALWDILQLLERAAIDIEMGYVSEIYFQKKYKTIVERVFVVSYPLINKVREEKGAESIFRNYEAFYIRTHYQLRPMFLVLLEYLQIAPNHRISFHVFAAHLNCKRDGFRHFVRAMFQFQAVPAQIAYVGNERREQFNERIRAFRKLECGVLGIVVFVMFVLVG